MALDVHLSNMMSRNYILVSAHYVLDSVSHFLAPHLPFNDALHLEHSSVAIE